MIIRVSNNRWCTVFRPYTIAVVSILFAFFFCPVANSSDIDEALIEAAENGQTEKVQVLLDAGADNEAKNLHYGYTALMMAAMFALTETCQLLVASGSDVNARSHGGLEGKTALMLIGSSIYTVGHDLVPLRSLLEAGTLIA